ncbi:flagellar biosynthetic protein FliO [Alkalicella caledoniensis]|uniref:Flagellar biosynthetic protein FliO n=1 Tax=Alkalicella caledoniensis TaxID=2731377 RepID=A0A7G9WCL7_ALKCA|nr:flagellar biosynthetic protein FliO [Alkalicella caledoniensis]QNO16429.1 flagellar biosynthetic protein FliO [Alkalicella caledoniensis]
MLDSIKLMLQGFLFLTILIILVLLAVFVIKFVNKKMTATSNNSMEIISGLAISPNKGVYIVKIVKSYYVIGLGENVNLLKEITDPEEIEILNDLEDVSSINFTGQDFSKILSNQISKLTKGTKGEEM